VKWGLDRARNETDRHCDLTSLGSETNIETTNQPTSQPTNKANKLNVFYCRVERWSRHCIRCAWKAQLDNWTPKPERRYWRIATHTLLLLHFANWLTVLCLWHRLLVVLNSVTITARTKDRLRGQDKCISLWQDVHCWCLSAQELWMKWVKKDIKRTEERNVEQDLKEIKGKKGKIGKWETLRKYK